MRRGGKEGYSAAERDEQRRGRYMYRDPQRRHGRRFGSSPPAVTLNDDAQTDSFLRYETDRRWWFYMLLQVLKNRENQIVVNDNCCLISQLRNLFPSGHQRFNTDCVKRPLSPQLLLTLMSKNIRVGIFMCVREGLKLRNLLNSTAKHWQETFELVNLIKASCLSGVMLDQMF